MKKLFIVLAVASLGFVSCNNSASDDQKKIDDSLAAKHVQDSLDALKPVTPPAPTAAEIEAKRVMDSTHIADSLAAVKKAPAKKAPAKK